MCIWSTFPSFSTLSLCPVALLSPLVLFWMIACGHVMPPLVTERTVLFWLFLKGAGSGVYPVYCKNGHRMVSPSLGAHDSAGETCY